MGGVLKLCRKLGFTFKLHPKDNWKSPAKSWHRYQTAQLLLQCRVFFSTLGKERVRDVGNERHRHQSSSRWGWPKCGKAWIHAETGRVKKKGTGSWGRNQLWDACPWQSVLAQRTWWSGSCVLATKQTDKMLCKEWFGSMSLISLSFKVLSMCLRVVSVCLLFIFMMHQDSKLKCIVLQGYSLIPKEIPGSDCSVGCVYISASRKTWLK